MKLRVKLEGFNEGRAALKSMEKRLRPAATKALQAFGDKAVSKLKADILGGKFGPPKLRGGGPALFDTGTYANSYLARTVAPLEIELVAEGANTHMSNAALAELLEYGTARMSARPHLRILGVWVQRNIHTVGAAIANELLGSS